MRVTLAGGLTLTIHRAIFVAGVICGYQHSEVVMSRSILLVAALVLTIVSASCDESFNPNAAFKPRMVVYSVLTTESDTQFVRIYTSYYPPENDPTNNSDEISVTDAVVKVSGTNPLYDARTYNFRSFDLKRPDQERYTDSIGAYYSFPFRPARGGTYRLTAVSPTYGNVTADLTLPTQGTIQFVNPFVLEDPWKDSVDIQLSIKLSGLVDAFLVRLFIEYDLYSPQTKAWTSYRSEVPFKAVVISKVLGAYDYIFPQLTLRQTSKNVGHTARSTDGYSFQAGAYQTVIERIVSHADQSRFRRAVCYLVQADEQLYRYYEEANRFNDRNSIRLDQPNYTNIQGGFGLFASMGIDSVEYPLPQRICPPPGPGVICH